MVKPTPTEIVKVEGEWRAHNVADLEACLHRLGLLADQEIALDFSACDIEDGIAIVTCINALRHLQARAKRLTLVGAPQMLGHNLYRVGLLRGEGAIHLVDMRNDEADGG